MRSQCMTAAMTRTAARNEQVSWSSRRQLVAALKQCRDESLDAPTALGVDDDGAWVVYGGVMETNKGMACAAGLAPQNSL